MCFLIGLVCIIEGCCNLKNHFHFQWNTGSQTGQTSAALKVLRNNRGIDAGAAALSPSFSLLRPRVNGVESLRNNVPGCR